MLYNSELSFSELKEATYKLSIQYHPNFQSRINISKNTEKLRVKELIYVFRKVNRLCSKCSVTVSC